MSYNATDNGPKANGLEKRKSIPAFDRRLLDYEEALKICLSAVSKEVPTKEVPLADSLQRVLRQDIESHIAVPPFKKSMMDGYAVKSEDVRSASAENPVQLRVIDEVPAGNLSRKIVRTGEAVRIMTGAAVPEGGDAVIKIEHTRISEGPYVEVTDAVGDNNFIIDKGQDLLPGHRIAQGGEQVTPALMGVMASCGVADVKVSRRPKIGIISTGSELVAPGRSAKEGQIYDINGYSLYGLMKAAGTRPHFLGVAADKSDDLLKMLKKARQYDILLLSGGVSVGDYDIVHETLQKGRVEEIFWRVKVKPGKPLFFGKKEGTLIFGLPGNPISSVTNFFLFVKPVIDKISGKNRWGLATGQAAVMNNRILKPGRRKFLRGQLRLEDSHQQVWILPEQRSGIFSPMTKADVMVEVPEDRKLVKEGDIVKVYYLDNLV